MSNITNLQNQIDNLDSTGSFASFATLAAYILKVSENLKFSVPTVDDLPNLTRVYLGNEAIMDGQIVYIENICTAVYADPTTFSWYAMDGSLIRKDVVAKRLYTWGFNGEGALGDNSLTQRTSPTFTTGGGVDWNFPAANYRHSGAIKTDGTLWMWGRGTNGQLGDNTVITKSSPIQTATAGTNWCYLSLGAFHTTAIKTDGTLWVWGLNTGGRLGTNDSVQYASPRTTAGGGTDWCQVSSGNVHTAAIKTDGTLWVWGCAANGRVGDNTLVNKSSPVSIAGGGTDWCQISLGDAHSTAMKTDGTIWTWGFNGEGRLGDGLTVEKCSPNSLFTHTNDWSRVSALGAHTVALKNDGTLWSWGNNNCGRLGDGTATNRCSPGTVAGFGTNWCFIGQGSLGAQTAAIKTDGTLWMWGPNANGQLGDCTGGAKFSPVTTILAGNNWVCVASGQIHTLAIAVT